jgi:hypothetical protein
LFTPLS